MVINQDITLADELDKDGDLEVLFYMSECDYEASRWLNRDEARTLGLNRDEARTLVEHLDKIFDLGTTDIRVARAEAYRQAKAHIQFPLCACSFSDDEETILSPCAAHAAWKKEEKNK